MKESLEIAMIFGYKPDLLLTELEAVVGEFTLVYLIDSYTRDNVIGFDDMAGYVFFKENKKYKAFWVYQTGSGGDRSAYDGLKIKLSEPDVLKNALEIIEGENSFEYLNGSKNINDRNNVAELIEDIKKSEGI